MKKVNQNKNMMLDAVSKDAQESCRDMFGEMRTSTDEERVAYEEMLSRLSYVVEDSENFNIFDL